MKSSVLSLKAALFAPSLRIAAPSADAPAGTTGGKYYGNTKHREDMSEADAKANDHYAKYGKTCT